MKIVFFGQFLHAKTFNPWLLRSLAKMTGLYVYHPCSSISAFVSPTLWAAHVIVACTVSTTSAAATPLVVHPVAAHMLGLCRVHATVMRKMGAANARIM